jgi:translation initiation factor IF-2
MAETTDSEITTIEIENMISVGTLAEQLSIPVSRLIGELFKNGVMATVNERIDFDTAEIIVEELNLGIKLTKKQNSQEKVVVHAKPKSSSQAKSRPPVVAVMGHVDHGKTSLLDAIRQANVVKHEAGGITQHISAYQVEHNGRVITFLDTPGHEAFAAIREHGAMLTDIVIIVVAADDGIKPQTVEAIRFARKAGVKIIVAINKIDKEGSDINRVKQQLAENNLLIEEWGGDTVVQAVSAKTKQGISELLDLIILVSDIEELKADYDVPGQGLIIEAHIEKGRGPIAQALVEAGTLKVGDFIVAGSSFAKIRNLETTDNLPIKVATPSMPVSITGFKTLPEFGEEFQAIASEKLARSQAEQVAFAKQNTSSLVEMASSELIRLINRDHQLSELNIIIKADVQGSLTSVIDSLKTLNTDEVAVRIVSSGLGSISENDVYLAHSSNAIIYGFNVSLPISSKRQASRDKVKLRLFNIIYELIDDVKNELSNLLSPEIIEKTQGKLIVKAIFKTTRSELICGGEVIEGKLIAPALARITRKNELIAETELVSLRRGPNEAKEIIEGELCGLNLKTTKKIEVKENDKIEVFIREILSREL